MNALPLYIPAIFVLIAVFTVVLLYKSSNHSKLLISILLVWLGAQAVISLTGFYTMSKGVPPRFSLLLMPPITVIILLFAFKKSRKFIDGFDVKTVTLIHIARIPVELTLYLLFIYKAIPEIMTFEGRNFDILCGLTTPIIYYWGYLKKTLNKTILLLWNITCLALLGNIVFTAILSAPLDFQKFGFEQPNVALFYFPFVWLPAFIVPAVFFAHLITIRKLIYTK